MLKKISIVLLFVLTVFLSSCNTIAPGAPTDFHDMMINTDDIGEDVFEFMEHNDNKLTKEQIEYNIYDDKTMPHGRELYSLRQALSHVSNTIMDHYAKECYVRENRIRKCKLFADTAELKYHSDEAGFSFNTVYYSDRSKENYDYIHVSRKYRENNDLTKYFEFRGHISHYIEYSENEHYISILEREGVLEEYMRIDHTTNELFRIDKRYNDGFTIAFLKDGVYANVVYNPETEDVRFLQLAQFTEDGEKEYEIWFDDSGISLTFYNIQFLDGWSYFAFNQVNHPSLYNEDDELIVPLDHNIQLKLYTYQELSDFGLSSNYDQDDYDALIESALEMLPSIIDAEHIDFDSVDFVTNYRSFIEFDGSASEFID